MKYLFHTNFLNRDNISDFRIIAENNTNSFWVKQMLDKQQIDEIAGLIAEEYKERLENAHNEGNEKLIVALMEETATRIITLFTEKKGMGELSINFHTLITRLLEVFPRFCFYFDWLHNNRNNCGIKP